jgi:ligand-binding SRPBCC domain-containing protein
MYTLEREVMIPAPREEVFEFFSDAGNLKQITPRWLGFEDVSVPDPMAAGAEIVHRIRWLGIPVKWTTVIESFSPPDSFVDTQVKGPYKYWRHEHRFEDAEGGTRMSDRVQYELPFGILGVVTHRLIVARQLKRIFDYRGRRIRKLFKREAAAA